MQNFFITIILSLFLSACSEENDKSNSKTQALTHEQTNNKITEEAKVIPKEKDTNHNSPKQEQVVEQQKVITIETEDSADNSKWDKIVAPQKGIIQEDNSSITEQDSKETNAENNTEDKLEASKQPSVSIQSIPTFNVSKDDIVLGNTKSNIILMEYFSPTCPHCAYYNKVIFPKIKEKYIDTNKITYIIREFISNKQDLDAAILARCNGSLDSFLQFQSVLLEQQDKWAYSNKYRELLTNIAGLGGVSAESYAKCLNNDQIIETLLANTKFITKAPGFIGTPSFFVNGEHVSKGYTFEALSNAIDGALKSSANNSK